jgi:ELWxxDGT repeat protein
MQTHGRLLRAALIGLALWISSAVEAVAQTVSVLADLNPGAFGSDPTDLFVAGGDLCFIAAAAAGDDELWCSDGTAVGTRSVSHVLPGVSFSNVTEVASAGSTRFVSGSRGTVGTELYVATAADAASVIDINPAGGSIPQSMVALGNILLFSADDGTNGRELWRSDGTPGGTFMVIDINSGAGSSAPAELALVGSEVYFAANDGANGVELWKTDGTALGTTFVDNISPGAGSSSPRDIVDLNGTAILAVAIFGSPQLYRSDGTSGGTERISTDVTFSAISANPRAIGDFVYLGAADATTGSELWRTDGEVGSVERVADVLMGGAGSSPRTITALGARVLFRASGTLSAGVELWRSDGSAETTQRVLDINPGGQDNVSGLRVLGSTLYFAADDGVNGIELWQSDSTAAGTFQTVDLNGTGGSSPRELTVFDGRLFFVADSTAEGSEVFVFEPPAVPALGMIGRLGLAALVGLLGLVKALSHVHVARA